MAAARSLPAWGGTAGLGFQRLRRSRQYERKRPRAATAPWDELWLGWQAAKARALIVLPVGAHPRVRPSLLAGCQSARSYSSTADGRFWEGKLSGSRAIFSNSLSE